jgi:EAL domain-containing protein (putative c-di-GMP-specific phosphodiesterase class I)/ActR/RegA family two-component response regulator
LEIEALRFLVVEDQGFQRWAMVRLLEALGAKHVSSAQDGRAALDLLATLDAPVDIVVSDLDMPGMDGMEFIRRLSEGSQAVSLIVSSGHDRALLSSVESMARAYGVKFLAAIEKPVSAAKLREALAGYGVPSPAPSAFPLPSATELGAALARGEFIAYFQPKVEMRTGAVVGAEALARWQRFGELQLEPQIFIPALEHSGLIGKLTEAMLAAACAAHVSWLHAGIHASVSVNLSRASLSDVTLADRLQRIAEGHGVKPQSVIFEITETAASTDLGKVLENLSRLRMRGFGLSLDDFGTGYSSMQQLTRIPFTELKIDQSFVMNAHTEPACRAMLESSLEIARKLDIPAVAEGVETRKQWQLLLELGCGMAQGYYSGAPMPLAGFMDAARSASGTP